MSSRLHAQAVGWIAWATVNDVGQDFLRIVSRLVLARLVWPEDFGLFTLAFTVVLGVQVATQLQLRALLVQRRQLSPEFLGTAHWSQVALGAAATVATVVLSGPIARMVGSDDGARVISVLSITVLTGSCLAVPRAWLSRELAFRQLASRGLASEALAVIVSIGAAALGAGVWALVVREVAGDVAELILLRPLFPWRSLGRWSRTELREIVSLGWRLTGYRGLAYVASQGDRIVVGRAFGAEVVGLYAVAIRLIEAFTQGIDRIVNRVAVPAFAHAQENPSGSRRGFLEACRAQALITFPVTIALALLAEHLVPLVLGPRWVGAVVFVQIVALRVLCGSLLSVPRASLLGRGHVTELLRLSFFGLAVCAIGWAIGLAWGPIGIAWGSLAGIAALAVASVWIATSELGIAIRDWSRALVPAVVGAAAMALGIYAVLTWLRDVVPASESVIVVLALGVGVLTFGLALAPWLPGEIRRHYAALRAGSDPSS